MYGISDFSIISYINLTEPFDDFSLLCVHKDFYYLQ